MRIYAAWNGPIFRQQWTGNKQTSSFWKWKRSWNSCHQLWWSSISYYGSGQNGKYANVIQGHDSITHVINSHEPFLSTLIGRYGNRIAGGKFILEGKEYSLTINNGPNSLHGGPTGFHTRIWDAEQETPQSLKLHYLSADGEEGFPGNLDIHVTYTLSNQNEFIITYHATTDKTTLVNLTHHGFSAYQALPILRQPLITTS